MSRWSGARRRLRAHVARLVPTTVIEYPFEVFVSALGFIIGTPLLAGLARPESLALLLPHVAYLAYGVALVLGAVTVAVALRRRGHPGGLASGLQLLGGSFAVYALAVVGVAGWAVAWAAFAAFALLGFVCLARRHHFLRLIDIQAGARRIRRRE